MATIIFDKVTKVYPNGFEAVSELDLAVREGEFMVLVGPSGCGKTTALRMVAGLEEITEGEVSIGDRVVNDVEPKERDIAMVFQNYALYPNMSVRQNIGFGLRLRRMPKVEIESKVTEAAELLGLTEWLDRKPAQLSGGQRQRVAMGRAIVREPSVFLMDEPLSNLDAKLRVQMRAEVARIQRRIGVATLYVTHDQVEAMTMGDRVAVLNGGVLQQCDEPEFVYDHPRNLFVAGFMGSPPMNLFQATVGEGATSVNIGSQRIAIPDAVLAGNPRLRNYTGRPIVLGVRPEELSALTGDAPRAQDVGVLRASVDLVEALGSEQLIHFTTDAPAVAPAGADDGDSETLSRDRLHRSGEGVARIASRGRVRAGDRMRFGIDSAALRFFDPDTTEAIERTRGDANHASAARPAIHVADGDGHDADRSHGRGNSVDGNLIAAHAEKGLRGPLTTLKTEALPSLSERVPVPPYARDRLTPGIVHFGVGGFHRAHQAMYIDRLLEAGRTDDWAICGVGVLAADRDMKQALDAQDDLYTLVVKHSDGRYDAKVIGSIVEYLFVPDDPEAVIARLANPSTRIVSLTITEGGYAIDDITGRFNPDAPGIADDLNSDAMPGTVFGLVIAGLARRRSDGTGPFTIMSCDNLPGNGSLAREAFLAFARRRDPALAEWIEQEVTFPNSMVDRITPATAPADRDEVGARFGIDDRWPVVCEPFIQWALEDDFCAGRPPLEEVGVQLVSEVAPYELMKLRLLNASHQGLCYLGRLCGYTYVHEAAQDPLFRAFLRGYMDEEATSTLDPVPGVDLDNYKDTLIERFSNPEIRDTIARLCAESSDRIPKWLLPVVRHQLAHDGPVIRSAAIVASWARYAEGVDEQGNPIEIVDRRREEIMRLAALQSTRPTAFIEKRELFGDLACDQRFVEAYTFALNSLHHHGARRTLETLVGEPARGGRRG